MDKQFARRLIDQCLTTTADLNSLLLEAQTTISKEEFVELRGGIALVLGFMLTDVINPTLKKFPDLQPEGFEPPP